MDALPGDSPEIDGAHRRVAPPPLDWRYYEADFGTWTWREWLRLAFLAALLWAGLITLAVLLSR